jgi:RNA polymerase sigma-70 factor (ECF subfamily)
MPTDDLDRDLATRIAAGDACAFDVLMARHKRPILNFVYRLTGDASEAEDIALEVFVKAYRALTGGGYRPGQAAVSTWLFQIARNAAVDYLRHRARRPTAPLSEMEGEACRAVETKTASQEMAAQETGAQIAAAVAELPEDQRTALILAAYEDRAQAEIAAIMQTSAKSVEARLYRARQFLRSRLAALRGE